MSDLKNNLDIKNSLNTSFNCCFQRCRQDIKSGKELPQVNPRVVCLPQGIGFLDQEKKDAILKERVRILDMVKAKGEWAPKPLTRSSTELVFRQSSEVSDMDVDSIQ